MSIAQKKNLRRNKLARVCRGQFSAFEALENRALYSTVVVNSVLDKADRAGSNTVTLRDAINVANHASTPTDITFDSQVFSSQQTITLHGSPLVIHARSALDAVTVTAPSAGLVIAGSHRGSDFVIAPHSTVTLSGLTITGGKSANGGGIDNNGNLTLVNCTISANVATNGGGVFNNAGTHGTTTLTNSTITGNTAKMGGGVYNPKGGKVTLTSSVVSLNSRTGTSKTGSDAVGVFSSTGLNLIGNADGSSGWNHDDVTGNSSAPASPLSNPLAGETALQTPSTLPAPIIIGPGVTNGSSNVFTTDSPSPTFTWNSVNTEITAYQLNLFDITARQFMSFHIDPGATSYTVSNALTAGDSFVWNLRVVEGVTTGPESQYLFFQTPGTAPVDPITLPVPTVIGPGATNSSGVTVVTSTTTPTFTWNAVSGSITGYQINLYDENSKAFVSFRTDANATSCTPSQALSAGDTFVWNLRVVDGSVTGGESQYLFFQTPKPAPVNPATLPVPTVVGPGATNSSGTTVITPSTTPTFTWNAVTGSITGYQINLYDETTKAFVSYRTDASATSFTLPQALPAGDTFVWNLRVVDGSVTGGESQYLFFTTPAASGNG